MTTIKKKMIGLGIALMMCLVFFTGCEYNKKTEQAQSGAYFATGDGSEYAVILDDKISLYWDSNNNRFDVFQFSLEGNSFVGESARAEISFKVSGDKLTITLKRSNIRFSKKIKLKRDSSIVVSDKDPNKLDAPNILWPSLSASDTYGNLSWRLAEEDRSSQFLHRHGLLGASVAIKRPNTDNFTDEIVRDYIPEPACFFYINFPDIKLTHGLNVLRIRHIGGPFVDSENKIQMSTDSEAVSLNVTVDLYGNITAIENQK